MSRLTYWLRAVTLLVVISALCFALAGPSQVNAGNGKPYEPIIDPANFMDEAGQPLPINNQYWPLVPGTTFIYEAQTEDGIERNEMKITSQTKQILGVTCVVVWDKVWIDGELAEETFDWYAQDKAGNVWYFGEDSKAYENGSVSTEGSWEAGVDGAKPGIVMLADPHKGDSYRQEYYEGVAEDMGKVLRLNASASVPLGYYDQCLLTKEWTPLAPGVVEHKYYARGVGLVLVEELKGKTQKVQLIQIVVE